MLPIALIHWLSGAFNPPVLLSFRLLPPSNNEGISSSVQSQILPYPSFQWREASWKRGFPYLPYHSHDKGIQISGMWSAIVLYTKGFVVSICWSQLRMILYAPQWFLHLFWKGMNNLGHLKIFLLLLAGDQETKALLTLPQFMPQFLHPCKTSGDFCILFKALDFNDYTTTTVSQLSLFPKASPVRESLQLFGIPPNTCFLCCCYFFFLNCSS